MKVLWFILFFKLLYRCVVGNDYSSFLTANASLAIIVDDHYMQKRNQDLLPKIQKLVEDITRETLKNGGINVRYFSWSGVRLKKEFLMAILIADCVSTWNFYESTQENAVTLLAITDVNCPRLPLNSAIMIPIIDRGEELTQILLDIKIQNVLPWKTCVFLFDASLESQSEKLISALMEESTKKMLKPVSIFLYQINDNPNLTEKQKRSLIHDIMWKFKKHQGNNFIVFSSAVNDILEIASNLEMFHVYNRWLFFLANYFDDSSSVLSIAQGLREGANTAFVVNETKSGCEDTIICSITEIVFGFVTALSKVIKEELILYGKISDEEWEAIRMTKSERQIEMLAYIREHLAENNKCSSCLKWNFKTMLSWGLKDQMKINTLKIETDEPARNQFIDAGFWTPVSGVTQREQIFPHSSHKFRNVTLNILTYNNPPWQILERNLKGDIVSASGIVIEILNELSLQLNFSYVLHELQSHSIDDNIYLANDGTIGIHTINIPENMKNILAEKNFLLAAVAATIDENNMEHFNYTIPISLQSYSFLARKPDEVNRIYLFTAPYSPTTWVCLILAVILTSPFLYLINKYNPLNSLQTKGLNKVKNCFWYVYGALLQQGGLYLPKADSGRVLVGVWWIVVIIIVTTYCGNLVAFLTFPQYQPQIEYLHEVFKHTEITKYGIRNSTIFNQYVGRSTRNDLKEFMKRATVYNMLTGDDIKSMKLGHQINVDWKINLQKTIENDFELTKQCDFVMGKEEFVDERIAMIVPHGSPFLDIINDEIKRLHLMGFINRWHNIYLPNSNQCSGKKNTRQITNHMVNLFDMQGCFLVLFFGFSFSILIIIFEFWAHRLYLSNQKRFKLFAH